MRLTFLSILVVMCITGCGPAPQNGGNPSPSGGNATKAAPTSADTGKHPADSQLLDRNTPSANAQTVPGGVSDTSPHERPDESSSAENNRHVPLNTPVSAPEEPSGLQLFAVFTGSSFFPAIEAVFTKPDGTPVTNDMLSEDGWGLSGNFRKVKAGAHYHLKLSSKDLSAPFFDKVALFSGEVMPRFVFGKIEFKLNNDLLTRINNAMNVKITRRADGVVFYDGLFKDLKARSIYGDTFPHQAVLEQGEYMYLVYDPVKKDDLIICDEHGQDAIMPEDACRFEISEDCPVVIVDLSPYIGIKLPDNPVSN